MSESTYSIPPFSSSQIERRSFRRRRNVEVIRLQVELIKLLRRFVVLSAEEGYDQTTRAERARTAQLVERVDDLLRSLVNPAQGSPNN